MVYPPSTAEALVGKGGMAKKVRGATVIMFGQKTLKVFKLSASHRKRREKF